MICKKCGFEYVDGLKECPNCQAPNEAEETVVLTEEERDTFGGLTIDTSPSKGTDDGYRVYDQEEQEDKGHKPGGFTFKVHTFGTRGLLWQILLLFIVLGIILIVLPGILIFALGAAICYYLYMWLF